MDSARVADRTARRRVAGSLMDRGASGALTARRRVTGSSTGRAAIEVRKAGQWVLGRRVTGKACAMVSARAADRTARAADRTARRVARSLTDHVASEVLTARRRITGRECGMDLVRAADRTARRRAAGSLTDHVASEAPTARRRVTECFERSEDDGPRFAQLESRRQPARARTPAAGVSMIALVTSGVLAQPPQRLEQLESPDDAGPPGAAIVSPSLLV